MLILLFTFYRIKFDLITLNEMTPEEKETYYRNEYFGEPLVEYIGFRCTKRLATFLKTQGMIEAKDHSAIIRRMLMAQAKLEGFES